MPLSIYTLPIIGPRFRAVAMSQGASYAIVLRARGYNPQRLLHYFLLEALEHPGHSTAFWEATGAVEELLHQSQTKRNSHV